ncbi:MAG: CDC27 family protein, partial [Candidatus Anammoxibacter sp.]
NNLYDSLAVGGYLIVSPSEMSNIFNHKFVSVNFSGATFYKKDNKKRNARFTGLDDPFLGRLKKQSINNVSSISIKDDTDLFHMANTVMPQPTKTRNISTHTVDKRNGERPAKTKEPEIKTNREIYVSALDLFKQGMYDEAVKLLLDIVANKKDDVRTISLLAQSYANKGELDQALEWSSKAISIDKINPACHYLNATILQEQGRTVEVVKALKRTLYLNNDFILAHFMIGNILFRQGKLKQSDRHFKNALILLGSCEPGDILPYSDGMTTGRLMEIIRSMKDVKVNC